MRTQNHFVSVTQDQIAKAAAAVTAEILVGSLGRSDSHAWTDHGVDLYVEIIDQIGDRIETEFDQIADRGVYRIVLTDRFDNADDLLAEITESVTAGL